MVIKSLHRCPFSVVPNLALVQARAFTDKPHNALASFAALKDTAPHNAGSLANVIFVSEIDSNVQWQSVLSNAAIQIQERVALSWSLD